MIWLLSGICLAAFMFAIRRHYGTGLAEQRIRVSTDSTVVQTTAGPVEYDLRGVGSTVLHVHGAK